MFASPAVQPSRPGYLGKGGLHTWGKIVCHTEGKYKNPGRGQVRQPTRDDT